MAKSSPLRQKLRGAFPRALAWNSAPSCLTHHLILSPFGHVRHRGAMPLTAAVWHPFLSTCPVTWSYGTAFHLSTPASNPSPCLHFKICYPNQSWCALLRFRTLYRCHVSSLNRTAAGNSQRENPRLFVTVVWWFLPKPGVGVKSSLPLTLQPCGLCAWQLPAL